MATRGSRIWQVMWGVVTNRDSGSMDGGGGGRRLYTTKWEDSKKLTPDVSMKRRVGNIGGGYRDHVKEKVPVVARDVLRARSILIHGVSCLVKVFPVLTCKFCSEVFIGKQGHLIRTCYGYKRQQKNQLHQWVEGSLSDILVPVETYHFNHMIKDVVRRHERFDFDRIPAVVELCWQAGADPHDKDLQPSPDILQCEPAADREIPRVLTEDDLISIANITLRAWETLRSGVKELLLAYPVKVCKYCLEVHVGPLGHRARLCGVHKYPSRGEKHFWMKATVDNLVPPQIVWRRRPQDPPVLVDDDRGFYGHAAAVVELCMQAGGVVPSKYFGMMKINGLPGPVLSISG